MRLNDLTGKKYGRLEVLLRAVSDSKKAMWLCHCDCGEEKTVRSDHLMSGRVVSCGCYVREVASQNNRRHGMSKTRIYRIWRDMINRCHYEKYPERHLYGGRGIIVCDRWRDSFDAFFADMGDAPAGMSIDRFPDTNGNYEPGNCRWATAKQQANNRRKPKALGHQQMAEAT